MHFGAASINEWRELHKTANEMNEIETKKTNDG